MGVYLKRTFEIEVAAHRRHICYNYGCDHWYYCLKHDEPDDGMQNCIAFKTEESKSYKPYRVD